MRELAQGLVEATGVEVGRDGDDEGLVGDGELTEGFEVTCLTVVGGGDGAGVEVRKFFGF
jgi:hypothetical protein